MRLRPAIIDEGEGLRDLIGMRILCWGACVAVALRQDNIATQWRRRAEAIRIRTQWRHPREGSSK